MRACSPRPVTPGIPGSMDRVFPCLDEGVGPGWESPLAPLLKRVGSLGGI